MFRELLESNHKDSWLHISYDSLIPYEQIDEADDLPTDYFPYRCLFILDSKTINGYGETKKLSLEDACLKYCIENGVKLEWLCQDVDGDYMKRILDDEWIDSATFSPATPLEAWLEYHLPRIMPDSRKLIFAILGLDIKIIA
jgi:hypothetical protein